VLNAPAGAPLSVGTSFTFPGTGLWSTPVGQRFSHAGKHYQLSEALALPKPVQHPGPPIIVGGRGARRTPELAARYADEFNVPFTPPAPSAVLYERVREASRTYGRAELGRAPLVLSAAVAVACGRTDAEVGNRLAVLREQSALPPEGLMSGSPDRVVEALSEYAEIGVTKLYIRLRGLADLGHLDLPDLLDLLDLLAGSVLPQLP
jgi:alkanesulfonate monooxygenase SsuD/methylene tetrahydromethanopterin reductase-like flavin-dependent oxidoreductase (luciferase family)